LPLDADSTIIERMFQGSLFGDARADVDRRFTGLVRDALDERCWVDHAPEWLAGADIVYSELTEMLEWRQRTVTMYERRLPEPRLTAWWGGPADGDEPLPVLADARHVLSEHYGVGFDTIGFNWYRDGDDSVAWHGDLRGPRLPECKVAILSVGARRPFRLRPRAGGRSIRYDLGRGDLLVMGGACQHLWQHCVPKVRHAGPRISITFRHSGIT
jgi:alkylated DNA repair dioxygenase AlkB